MDNVNIDIDFCAYYNSKKKIFDEGGVYPFLEYLKGKKLEKATVRIDTDFYPYEETDIYCEKLTVKKLSYETVEDDYEFIAHVTTDAKSAKVLIKVLCELGFHGNGGHSFGFEIVGDKKFSFDGDGADRIMKINGIKVRSNKNEASMFSDMFKAGQQHEDENLIDEDRLQKIIQETIKKVMKY